MRLELALVLSLIAAGSVFAETAAEEPQENPELEREIAYVEALVDSGYPDLASPVIEATKKRWATRRSSSSPKTAASPSPMRSSSDSNSRPRMAIA